jgi:hypothetical protein
MVLQRNKDEHFKRGILMLRVGIIGVGRIAAEFTDNHVVAYKGCKDTEIKVLCDINIGKAYDCAERYNLDCSFYDSVSKINEPLDIISICTRPDTHRQVLESIIDTDELKAIYCEKPIATNLKDARMMIGFCKERDIILQINHQRRFGRSQFSFARGMENTGTHAFDLLRIYFGDIKKHDDHSVITPSGLIIDINEIKGGGHDFLFNVPTPSKGLLRLGVEHLVECIKGNSKCISTGEDGYEALKFCLEFKNGK